MPQYDAKVLQSLADRSHQQSRFATIGGVATGIISGGLFGYAATLIFSFQTSYLVPGAIGGTIFGVLIGRQKALALRLQSQTALCLIEIEKHAKKSSTR